MEEFTHAVSSPLGIIRISGNESSITAVSFTGEGEATESGTQVPEHLLRCANQLAEYFAGTRQTFDVPLEPAGTDFQKRVWKALVEIPFAETTSYLALSQKLGDEKAIRAVGLANGKNPVAIIIPCHRVIGSDGSLTGYAGGLQRKDWLLRHEGGWPKSEQLELF